MTASCDHCLLTFPERDAVYDEMDGVKRVFCCNGCRGIYRLVHEEGLDKFYERRTGWRPGPPEEARLTPGVFETSVRLEGEWAEIDLHISGLRCASCVWLIEHYLSRLPGITYIRVNYATHRARLKWLPAEVDLETVLKKIKALGYTPRPYTVSGIEDNFEREKKDLLIRFGTASFFSMQLMLYTAALYAGYFQGIEPLYRKAFEIIALALATPVMFYCGYPFLKGTVSGLRNRHFSMDVLVFAGAFSAYLYSVVVIFVGGEVYFDTSAMIITLILLGRFIEAGAKAKAAKAIAALLGLQPKEAKLLNPENGETASVQVSALKVGDRVEVLPGEKVPVDCAVLDGSSELDESMLTGEAAPVGKTRGMEVFGGTMNLNGRLLLEVRKIGKDTMLAQIIKAVEDAQIRKAPVQKTADRVVGWFVPAIIIISIATAVFRLAGGGTVTFSLMTAVSVLVIACPCALGLATPLAVLIGSTQLYSKGILAKGGDALETIARADFVSFDKTGTLTAGVPVLSKIVSYDIDPGNLHALAASLEKNSEHTIAKAVCAGIVDSELYKVEDFKAHHGRGIEGRLKGEHVFAGNPSFLGSAGVEIGQKQKMDFESFSSKGNTVIGFAAGGTLKGWLVISDDLRPGAPGVVGELRNYGCEVGLITGDHRAVAEEIGKMAGISIIEAEVLPHEKAEKVRALKGSGRRVIMVGDGVNDAPALIEADAGVAMGGAADVALESADIVLMRNDLGLIPMLLDVAKKTLSIIRQNLFWAFSYNLVAIPLAVSGGIHPVLSAAFMAISSLLVVGNSMRLYKGSGVLL